MVMTRDEISPNQFGGPCSNPYTGIYVIAYKLHQCFLRPIIVMRAHLGPESASLLLPIYSSSVLYCFIMPKKENYHCYSCSILIQCVLVLF